MDLLYCRGRPYRSLSSDLCLSGDLLLRRGGEEREGRRGDGGEVRRRGDGDLRLRGERLTLRREDERGLGSLERSSPSALGRFLAGESCRSATLLLLSGERLRPLRGEARVLEGELGLDVLSETEAEGWSLCLLAGLWTRL